MISAQEAKIRRLMLELREYKRLKTALRGNIRDEALKFQQRLVEVNGKIKAALNEYYKLFKNVTFLYILFFKNFRYLRKT